ncbi:MAG TPA: Rrf2 family transcriptional regulator [Pararhizobium sp.]|nr:Rrf2 family transcriptional regulator [Pararhizobium sp.]
MRLTTFSDYALRVLLYAANAGERLVTIEETARTYQVSRAHLMKVVNILTKTGYLRGVRGRSGGFTLAKRPEDVNLGEVMRATEPDFALVECFAPGNRCMITNSCRLPQVLNEALDSFVATLGRYTLADIMLKEIDFLQPGDFDDVRRGPSIALERAGS